MGRRAWPGHPRWATGLRLFAGMHQSIAALSRAGNNVVADHVLVEPAWIEECAALFYDLPAYLVGVSCPLEVLEARERGRKDRTLGQARAQFPLVHARCVYDLEVDTSVLSPMQCAEQIRDMLQNRIPPTAFKRLKGMD